MFELEYRMFDGRATAPSPLKNRQGEIPSRSEDVGVQLAQSECDNGLCGVTEGSGGVHDPLSELMRAYVVCSKMTHITLARVR